MLATIHQSSDLMPPRFDRPRTSMAIAAAAVVEREQVDPFAGLGIYDLIPDRHDVVSLRRHVAVFERREVKTAQLAEGGLYVYEHQKPVAGSPQPDARRICTRKVVRIFRNTRPGIDGEAWWTRDVDSPFLPGDGPWYDWGLCEMLIGRVVGIYIGTGVSREGAQ